MSTVPLIVPSERVAEFTAFHQTMRDRMNPEELARVASEWIAHLEDRGRNPLESLVPPKKMLVECVVCYDMLPRGWACGVCKHALCTDCFSEISRRRPKCPMCRSSMPADSGEWVSQFAKIVADVYNTQSHREAVRCGKLFLAVYAARVSGSRNAECRVRESYLKDMVSQRRMFYLPFNMSASCWE